MALSAAWHDSAMIMIGSTPGPAVTVSDDDQLELGAGGPPGGTPSRPGGRVRRQPPGRPAAAAAAAAAARRPAASQSLSDRELDSVNQPARLARGRLTEAQARLK
jgi:hypothetical protein